MSTSCLLVLNTCAINASLQSPPMAKWSFLPILMDLLLKVQSFIKILQKPAPYLRVRLQIRLWILNMILIPIMTWKKFVQDTKRYKIDRSKSDMDISIGSYKNDKGSNDESFSVPDNKASPVLTKKSGCPRPVGWTGLKFPPGHPCHVPCNYPICRFHAGDSRASCVKPKKNSNTDVTGYSDSSVAPTSTTNTIDPGTSEIYGHTQQWEFWSENICIIMLSILATVVSRTQKSQFFWTSNVNYSQDLLGQCCF